MKQEDRLNRVTELTSRLIDDLATPEEQQELNDLLTGDPDACERYLDVTETHAVLTHEHLADDLRPSGRARRPSEKSGSPLTWWFDSPRTGDRLTYQ